MPGWVIKQFKNWALIYLYPFVIIKKKKGEAEEGDCMYKPKEEGGWE